MDSGWLVIGGAKPRAGKFVRGGGGMFRCPLGVKLKVLLKSFGGPSLFIRPDCFHPREFSRPVKSLFALLLLLRLGLFCCIALVQECHGL